MPKRFLKFSDRWMFNRVLCEEEVCRKVLRAALGIEVGEIAYLMIIAAFSVRDSASHRCACPLSVGVRR